MKQVLNAQVLGARLSNVDGRSFVSVYITQPAEGDNDAGQIPMKLGAEPKLFLELQDILRKGSPADIQLETIMKMATGGTMKMQIVGIVPPAAAARSAAAPAKA